MSALSPKEAVLRLLELGDAALLGIEGTGDTVVLYLLEGDEERRIELRILANDLTPVQPQSLTNLSPPADLPEVEARARGLPLYLSREWFLKALVRHREVEEIAAEFGYAVEVLRAYRQAHGLTGTKQEMIRFLWQTGKYRRQKELAEDLGIAPALVSSIVGHARDEELDARIRELLDAGVSTNNIIDTLQREGSRKARGRLQKLITAARTRRH